MNSFVKSLLPSIKVTLRRASDEFDEEISSYIETAATDLQGAGILSSYFVPDSQGRVDPQIRQAVRWYCLSVFGLYNEDMEKYAKAYASLKSTLATQRKYTELEDDYETN